VFTPESDIHLPISARFPHINCTNLKHLSIDGHLIADENDDALSSVSHIEVFDARITLAMLKLLVSKCSDGRPVLDFTILKKILLVFDQTRLDRSLAGLSNLQISVLLSHSPKWSHHIETITFDLQRLGIERFGPRPLQ
jgi:predicted MPP superfamily phosphohydrolase